MPTAKTLLNQKCHFLFQKQNKHATNRSQTSAPALPNHKQDKSKQLTHWTKNMAPKLQHSDLTNSGM